MLVSKETSQAWKERHDLLKLMEKQHQEMRDKLLETKIGVEPMHSPINRVEAQIRTLEDLYQVIGPLPQLKQIGEDLKSMYDKMLDIPEMEQPKCSPVELYEAKLSIVQDALSILEQGRAVEGTRSATSTQPDLSLSEEDLAGASKEKEQIAYPSDLTLSEEDLAGLTEKTALEV